MIKGLSGSGDDDDVAGDQYPEVRFLYPQPAPPRAHRYNELLSRLIGYRLQSAQFVDGYVQLGFVSAESPDVPVLTCEAMPVVVTPTGPIADGETGYADAIRSLLGDNVIETSEAPREGLRIGFAERALELRPSAAELTGPVIAMLSDFGDGRSMTWRPGGEAFEYLG